uniref:Uncharacterized protein n=1 Tax=Octopus bimaculoides TaxID=37653 RepID=A0A0L8IFS7_OCTBM
MCVCIYTYVHLQICQVAQETPDQTINHFKQKHAPTCQWSITVTLSSSHYYNI